MFEDHGKPPRLNRFPSWDTYCIPDPIPGEDGHYRMILLQQNFLGCTAHNFFNDIHSILIIFIIQIQVVADGKLESRLQWPYKTLKPGTEWRNETKWNEKQIKQ